MLKFHQHTVKIFLQNAIQYNVFTVLTVFSGPVFGGSKQIMASSVRKGLYLLGMHYSPWCRGRK